MIQSASSNTQIRVNSGDWKNTGSELAYMGKYQVGCFTLSYGFMIQYMHIVHHVPIDINRTSNNMNDENIVMSMQQYDIIDNHILSQMREMIKKPKHGFSIFRENNLITGIYRDNNHE